MNINIATLPSLFAGCRAHGVWQRHRTFSERRRLAGALSAALLAHLATGAAEAATVPFANVSGAHNDAQHSPQAPQNWSVQTCDDTTGPGSLRYIAVHAQSGDTIDFSQLPVLCGMNESLITLTAGEIVLHQADITLVGPAMGHGTVTLSGAGQSRVLRHQIYSPFQGALQITGLRIVDGNAQAPTSIYGGCVYSDANIYLTESLVEGCVVSSDMGSAGGGGLDAPHGKIRVLSSKVSGNTVRVGSNGNANGGGLSSHELQSKYSEIVGNSAQGSFSQGGGAWFQTATIMHSTIAANASELSGGGIFINSPHDLTISNSTFYENHSSAQGGSIFARSNNLVINNSTIASNSSDASYGGGVYFDGTAVEIQSTIIAGNTSGVANGTDFYIRSGLVTGADNAIISSNASPPGLITLTEDPRLASLGWTGGPTRTINLLPDSPAIGIGNNVNNWTTDQRGPGFPRTTGPAATVDMGAVQATDRIFASDVDQIFL